MPVVFMNVGRYCSQKVCYLSEDATPLELWNYVKMFLAAMGVCGLFSTGPKTDVWVDRVGDGDCGFFNLIFRTEGHPVRIYNVYSDRVVRVFDNIHAGTDTDGYHAWFISAHLRAAWIIQRKGQQVAVVASSN